MPGKHGAQPSVNTVKGRLYIVGLIALLLSASLLIYHERHTTLLTDATTHKIQPYTELYFSQTAQLPSQARPGQSLPLAFTIHNVEGRNSAYTYAIDFTTADGHTAVLDQQQITIADGHTENFNVGNLSVPQYSGRAEVSVVLVDKPEAIHFWIANRP